MGGPGSMPIWAFACEVMSLRCPVAAGSKQLGSHPVDRHSLEAARGNPCKPSVSARIASREGGYSAVEGNSRREFNDDQETKRAALSRIHGDRRGGSRCRRRRRHLRRLGHGEHVRGAHGRAHATSASRASRAPLASARSCARREAHGPGRVRSRTRTAGSAATGGARRTRPTVVGSRMPRTTRTSCGKPTPASASGRKSSQRTRWLGTRDVQSDQHRDVGASDEHEGAVDLRHRGGWKPSPGEPR